VNRATRRLTIECNNACLFCGQDGVGEASPAPDAERIDELTIVGGEPTLAPGLLGAVRAARADGCRRVGIQTNGHRLAELAADLANAGLTDVHVSLHGAEAAVHDYHTAVAGSLEQLLAGIAASRRAGLTVVATTVLTRSNYRVLGAIPALLQSRGVAAWQVAVPRAVGRALHAFDRIMPRLGLALPFALHATERARAVGIPVWIAGAPLCALGPFAAHSVPEPSREYGAACESCPARPQCPGLDTTYLRRFGGDELSPRDAPVTLTEEHTRLRRMFVGMGASAPPEQVAVPAPPREARLQLPVLGKGQPGPEEAPRTAEKKTGEALRDVFPDLFET
jgi:hypothetical protein